MILLRCLSKGTRSDVPKTECHPFSRSAFQSNTYRLRRRATVETTPSRLRNLRDWQTLSNSWRAGRSPNIPAWSRAPGWQARASPRDLPLPRQVTLVEKDSETVG